MTQNFREFISKRSTPGGGVSQTIMNQTEAFNGPVMESGGSLNDSTSSGPSPPKIDSVNVKERSAVNSSKPNKNSRITPVILIAGIGTLIIVGIYLTKDDELNKSNN